MIKSTTIPAQPRIECSMAGNTSLLIQCLGITISVINERIDSLKIKGYVGLGIN